MFSGQKWSQCEAGDGFLAFLAAGPSAADFVLSTLQTSQCAMLSGAPCATGQVQAQCVLQVLVYLLYITFYDLRETWWGLFSCSQRTKMLSIFLLPQHGSKKLIYIETVSC